jgi:hypothetical protein
MANWAGLVLHFASGQRSGPLEAIRNTASMSAIGSKKNVGPIPEPSDSRKH